MRFNFVAFAVACLSLSAVAYAQSEQVTIGPRVSIPSGKATGSVDWNDLLSDGVGFDLRYARLWKTDDTLSIGVYGKFLLDSYGGRSVHFTDPTLGPVTVKPDSLLTYGLEVGAVERIDLGGFYLEPGIGLGLIAYHKTDATVNATGGSADIEAVEGGAKFMFSAGARLSIPVSPKVEIGGGARFQLNGAPSAGSGFTGLDFEGMHNLVLSLDLSINF